MAHVQGRTRPDPDPRLPKRQQGYRVSWETAIGRGTESVFLDNTKAWSGDHCIDPSLIPGVLFCNHPIQTDNPRLLDLGPTILQMFGVDVPDHMDGKPMAVEGGRAATRREANARQRGGVIMKRRTFLLGAAAAAGAAAVGAGGYWLGSQRRVARSAGTMVIVIGIDGMDPVLSESMMKEGKLPNLAKLRDAGGFSPLGTSCPPQSPVAWANFINGAGPGSHGIFDFIHRHPEHQCRPFYSAAETLPGQGGWEIGEHKIPLDFWPFNHKPAATVLKRQGEPFWDFLDAAGVPTTFYDLPSNYPPSPSKHGHHRCICGMGTPDLLGGYGTYQYFAEDVVEKGVEEQGGKRSRLSFSAETAKAQIVGPDNGLLKKPEPITLDFLVHRDRKANAAVIEISGQRILLKAGQWSRWTKLTFTLPGPVSALNQSAVGICRFYLQEVAPNFRLYMTPINIDPSAPAVQLSEPPSFIQDVSKKRGLFYTTGFQEDHKARSNGVFVDDEYARQAQLVLDERLALFEYAVDDYDGGLLFFYFSSSDLQSHMFWWNSDEKHPTRSANEAKKYFGHIHRLYEKLDQIVGDVVDCYGSRANHLRDERSRLRQLRPTVQPQLVAARIRLPRPSRVYVDHDGTSTGR